MEYMKKYKRDSEWTHVLRGCEHAHNSAKHSVTGVTPYEIVFGQQTVPTEDTPAIQHQRRKARSASPKTDEPALWRKVKEKLEKAAEVNARVHNSRHIVREFEVGDYVWVDRNIRQDPGLNALKPKWVGPLRIKEKRNPSL